MKDKELVEKLESIKDTSIKTEDGDISVAEILNLIGRREVMIKALKRKIFYLRKKEITNERKRKADTGDDKGNSCG